MRGEELNANELLKIGGMNNSWVAGFSKMKKLNPNSYTHIFFDIHKYEEFYNFSNPRVPIMCSLYKTLR